MDNTELKGKANLTVSSGQSSEKTYIDETGNLVVGDDQTAGQLTISGTYTEGSKTVDGKAVVEVIALTNLGDPSIKNKFGITTVTTPYMSPAQVREAAVEAVRKTFTALHLFIQNGGLENKPDVIKPGDYIDLEGGLEIVGDNGGGVFASGKNWNVDIPGPDTSLGRLSRLIVVGINSFKTDTTVNSYYKYPGKDTPPSHVVFQFQHVAVEHRMTGVDSSSESTNAGGYPASEMRKYLTWVDGNKAENGSFLTGLEKAGVPEEVLWGPSRVMSTKGGTKTINDLLWLPTDGEMYGITASRASNEETKTNQPCLAYYGASNLTYKKVDGNQTYKAYWLASAGTNATMFCVVNNYGLSATKTASIGYGCAPAFCVY